MTKGDETMRLTSAICRGLGGTLGRVAALVAVAFGALGGMAQAEEWAADEMVYTNDGAFVSVFYVVWKGSDGNTCRMFPKNSGNNLSNGETIVVDLSDEDNFDFTRNYAFGDPKKCKLKEGTEVWGWIDISSGDGEKCKKSSKVLYHPSGKTIRYKTGGTTLNNNRCKVTQWPSTTYASVSEESN